MGNQVPIVSARGLRRDIVGVGLCLGVALLIGGCGTSISVPPPPAATAESPTSPTSLDIAVATAPAMPGDGQATTPDASRVAGGLVLEDWSRYADSEAVKAAFISSDGWGAGNDMMVAPNAGQLDVAYTIKADAPNDYVGMERDLSPVQDWRDYGKLTTTVQSSDASGRELVLQFTEGSGEAWRHRLKLTDLPADGRVSIPLTADQWEWADWSEPQNKVMDLDAVTNFGLFIGHVGTGDGELVLGPLVLQR